MSALLSRTGELIRAPVVLFGPTPPITRRAIIASDGKDFLVVTHTEEMTCVNCFEPMRALHVAHLDSNLRLVGPSERKLFEVFEHSGPTIAWDGTSYVVVYSQNLSPIELHAQRISRTGEPIGESQKLHDGELSERTVPISLTPVPGGLAATVNTGSRESSVYFIKDAQTVERLTFPGTEVHPVPLDRGRTAIVNTGERSGALHYDAQRIMMTIADAVAPASPDAPELRASLVSGRIHLQWTAPAQPINGYRLEYRIENNSWKEIDRWIERTSSSINVLPAVGNATYGFRIRAVSDGGMSPYSLPAEVHVGKRRSVR